MDYQQGLNRDQWRMVCWEDRVESDAFVRIIDLLVDALPPEELGFRRAHFTLPVGSK